MVKPDGLLKDILHTIENELKEDINPDILAGYYNLSTRHLERIFKYAFNANIGTYIRSRKLAASLNDLLKTDEKVISIALEYGFEFEPSYIRSFKREFGITPGEFRKSGRVVNITPPLCASNANKLPDAILSEQEIDLIPRLYIVGGNSYGNVSLPDSPFGFYELWTEKGNDNKLIWYGSQDNGTAFRTEWNNVKSFMGRIGYVGNGGKTYEYNHYCDFSFNRIKSETKAGLTTIGIYGLSENPPVEFYIAEDWFGDNVINHALIGRDWTYMGEYFVDGSTYNIYKVAGKNLPGIEGLNTFQQFISVRQTTRQTGTISITEHFKEWEKRGMILGKNMNEVKFFIASECGTGWFDAKYVSLYYN